MSWSPPSWRGFPAAQQPAYPDAIALRNVESCLEASPPITLAADCARLLDRLADVADGKAFLLQGGDCAESFAEFSAEKVGATYELMNQLRGLIEDRCSVTVVAIGRIAGQFAKPRSSDEETVGEISLPSYRGDLVNGLRFDLESRRPDPLRLLEAHRQSSATVRLLGAFAAAAIAQDSDLHREARMHLGLGPPTRRVGRGQDFRLFTSHEALLLAYEQALTRFDHSSGKWWSASAHMLWIGDRTRQLGGAHVEYARGIANPLGLKCGPGLNRDELLRLIDRLDPENKAGRLVLIGRFGAGEIERCLPPLIKATRDHGRKVIWSIDPCHGNTKMHLGRKTRFVDDMVVEIRSFFEIARSEGVHPGGLHLELSGEAVTECIGEHHPRVEDELSKAYRTHCDPRLNARQATSVISEVTALIGRGTIAQPRAA